MHEKNNTGIIYVPYPCQFFEQDKFRVWFKKAQLSFLSWSLQPRVCKVLLLGLKSATGAGNTSCWLSLFDRFVSGIHVQMHSKSFHRHSYTSIKSMFKTMLKVLDFGWLLPNMWMHTRWLVTKHSEFEIEYDTTCHVWFGSWYYDPWRLSSSLQKELKASTRRVQKLIYLQSTGASFDSWRFSSCDLLYVPK